MKQGRVFFVGNDAGTLVPMDETDYEKEDILQKLLEDYPDLLPGDQIDPEAPRRWLLVAREMGIPDELSLTDRWSLDHLYLDQDGVPTFVECKRSSDTRARREVVAQMLDYAANGTKYWGIDRIRRAATESAQRRGRVIEDEVRALIGAEEDVDITAFWQQVEANLNSKKVRLIFVADTIPSELRQLVEFLNDRMVDVEVLAVEVKQFLGAGNHKVIVPRLIGMTEKAREKKTSITAKAKTTREQFLAKCTPVAQPVFTKVLDEAVRRSYTLYWGTTGFSIRTPINGTLTSFLYGYPSDRLEVYTGYLPLDEVALGRLRKEWLDLGVFRRHGEHTLRAVLTGDRPDRIHAAISAVMDRVETLTHAELPNTEQGTIHSADNI